MPRYGISLQDILVENGKYLSDASILHLGLSLLNILEVIHESGQVYNDLKPDNILIGLNQKVPNLGKKFEENIFKNIDFHLIDFGFAS